MLQIIRDLYPNEFEVTPPYKEGMYTMLAFNIANEDIINNKMSLEDQFKLIEKDTEIFKNIRKCGFINAFVKTS